MKSIKQKITRTQIDITKLKDADLRSEVQQELSLGFREISGQEEVEDHWNKGTFKYYVRLFFLVFGPPPVRYWVFGSKIKIK